VRDKGFGFIADDNQQREHFFHSSNTSASHGVDPGRGCSQMNIASSTTAVH
jgi:cold shock CspA family protein